MTVSATLRPPHRAGAFFLGFVTYAALLLAFWLSAHLFGMEARIGGHMASTFASFALLLAPYWAFGFGAAERLRSWLRRPAWRVLAPGLLVLPYMLFALPRGEFRPSMAAVLFAIPMGIAALFEFVPPRDSGLCWQDVVVLAAVGLPVEFRLLHGAWPLPGLAALPKFLLVDAALYAFLVVRRLEGVGYDFRLRGRDLLVGLREWLFFAPIGIALGLAVKFIAFRPQVPDPVNVAAAWLITFFFVAVPEELFFRGVLQNLLEVRVGRLRALLIAAVIFGLSHFNKPLPFNWRYVLLATIAGIFYGRAWRDRRRLFCSSITHTTVDVVWSVWFR